MPSCSDLITRNPVWCLASDVVSSAAQLMKHEEVGLLPVLDGQQDKKVIGVVTDRDLVLKVLAEGRRPDATPIGEVMTANPVTCRADDALEGALAAMAQHQIRRVPVVNEDGAIVGIIAQADVVLRVNDPTTTSEIVRKISKPTPIHPSMAIAK
jgi:CBS domain-containing protein